MVALLAFIVLVGVLITAHEFGHYIVAKLSGVKVQIFSVGFGRAVLSKTVGETEYRVAWLPLGGYVKLAGMDPDETDPTLVGRRLMDKPPIVRILIYAAGPAMNLLLPFAIMAPMLASSDRYDKVVSSTIGAVDKGLPAYGAGLREGDQITAIDGEPVDTFWQVAKHIDSYSADDGPLQMQIQRAGVEGPLTIAVRPERVEQTDRLIGFKKDYFRIGYQPLFLGPDVAVSDPAGDLARAGAQTFDRILQVDGVATPRYIDVERALGQIAAGRTVAVQVERDVEIDPRLPFLTRRVPETLTYTATAAGPGVMHAGPCVSSVGPGTPAGEVLQRGDCILSIDGEAHTLGAFVLSRLTNRPEEPKALRVLRAGQVVDVTLTPRQVVRKDNSAGELKLWAFGLVLLSRPDGLLPLDEVANPHRLAHAWYETSRRVSYEIQLTVDAIAGMFTGRVSPTQLSGPLRIARLAGEHAEAGIDSFLRLMMLLSLSIALLNLLPIPMLDGGHIMVAAIEMVIRRPLPERVQLVLQQVGVAIVLALILFALFNDVMNEWRLRQG